MFTPISAFGGFSVNDLEAAKAFYGDVLGLGVEENMGGMQVQLPGGATLFVYVKADHQPASYTTLNFVVDDINAAVDALAEKSVSFERYEGMQQDEKGVARGKAANMGPDIAWFKDPAGNILAVLQS